MSQALNQQILQRAFEGRPDIIGAITGAVAHGPAWIELFNEISEFVSSLRTQTESPGSDGASKKRKLESTLPEHPKKEIVKPTDITASANGAQLSDANEESLVRVQEISMVVPFRKKFIIDITPSCIRARDPKTNEVVDRTTYRWDAITSAFCVPVPEKSAKQYNYVLFNEDSQIVTNRTTNAIDPLVLTIPATAPKPGSLTGSDLSTASAVSDQHKTLFDHYLTQQLKAAGRGVTITEANPKLFSSAIKEAHRPNEPAVHVKAFRGSKDGYLYFLPNGILWGFKKPLLFLPKDQLVAVSYVNVLQRTFNMAIELDVRYKQDDGSYLEEREELEFGMIDQEDFAGIDAYVKRNGLQDSSMAEQRKAKRLGVNTVKGEDGEKVDVGDPGELTKAEAALEQNDEGEEEEDEGTDGEDFDPGSEGESEGSGSSSEEESEAEGGGQGNDDDDDDDEEEEL